jgi:hypothetical protein
VSERRAQQVLKKPFQASFVMRGDTNARVEVKTRGAAVLEVRRNMKVCRQGTKKVEALAGAVAEQLDTTK